MEGGYIYIMSNKNRTTLYIGVTGELKTRIVDHKSGIGSKFTTRYQLIDLIYYEEFPDIYQAIDRENN